MGEDEALSRLGTILASSEFQTGRELSIWEQVLLAASQLLADLAAGLVGSLFDAAAGRGGILGYATLAVAFALVVVITGGFLRALSLSVGRASSHAAQAAAARRERSDRLWQRAQALATAGQYAEAARALYLSALYALEEHNLLEVREWLTNREHAERMLRDQGQAGGAFAALVQRYDHLRYGGFPADGAAFGELRALAEQARGMRPEAARTTPA